jgi:hypothetical protein
VRYPVWGGDARLLWDRYSGAELSQNAGEGVAILWLWSHFVNSRLEYLDGSCIVPCGDLRLSLLYSDITDDS